MQPTFALSFIKSLPFDFVQAVTDFVQAKKDHLTTEGAPAPTAHPAVEASVRRIAGSVTLDHHHRVTQTPDDFVADYQIVDDTPPPPTPAERKQTVAAKIAAEAQALLNEVTPPLKARLWQMHVAEAMAIPNGTVLGTQDQRTDAHKATIAEAEARTKRTLQIMRHLAELESQLHDLPDDMIDLWKHAPFPQS